MQAIRVISFSAAQRHAHGHDELDIHNDLVNHGTMVSPTPFRFG
jgi:hypothetical protein